MNSKNNTQERSYWSSYLAGSAIGLTLILTYYVMGHGVGASGAYTQWAAKLLQLIAPDHAQANTYLKDYLKLDSIWQSWIVIEMLGVLLGGFIGAVTAKRFRFEIEHGTRIGRGGRLLLALLGRVGQPGRSASREVAMG
jgi:hypothetical protein